MIGNTTFGRDNEWLKAAIGFSHGSFNRAKKIKAWPVVLRPIVAPWISQIRKDILRSFRTSEKLALPVLAHSARDDEQANDFTRCPKNVGKGKRKEEKFIAMLLVLTAFASVHTSASTIVGLIYDLCEHPEYYDVLRKEYQGILDKKADIPKGGFSKMLDMDGLLKENQRLRPITLCELARFVHIFLTEIFLTRITSHL